MYLSRIFLNPLSPSVHADLRDPEGMHKTLMRAFPDDAGPSPRQKHGVLYRVEREGAERVVLLVQSKTRPSFDLWPDNYVLDLGSDPGLAFAAIGPNPALLEFGARESVFEPGRRFAFRLCANTTRKIDTKTGPDGKKRNGRRVPVHGDEGRIAWLRRHAETSGFTFESAAVRVSELPSSKSRHKSITLGGAQFDGVLEIRDHERFVDAVEHGIGPAKAYGFGLLSLRAV